MPQPTAIADYATLLSARPPASGHADAGEGLRAKNPRSVRRFAEIKAHLAGDLPYVSVGSVYEDMDPRNTGRLIQVLKVAKDARVLVRVLQSSDLTPRTPADQRRDTTNDTQWIAQIRFREGSRGFRYLYRTDPHQITVYLAACQFAEIAGIDMTVEIRRLAGALAALLPGEALGDYLAQWRRLGTLSSYYAEHGITGILANAAIFGDNTDRDLVVTSHAKAARTATRYLAD